MINFHATLIAPNEDEKYLPKTSLRGVQTFFGWPTWESHQPTPSFWGAYFATWESHP